MPSMKALKRRITSVKNIQQIMKAMNLVAASKVQKYKNRMEAVRPLFNEANTFMTSGVSAEDAANNAFFEKRDTKRVAYVVMSGERGLCGSYNANILKTALAHMDERADVSSQIIAVGATCKEYFLRRRKSVISSLEGALENVSYVTAENVMRKLVELYSDEDTSNRVDEVYLAYTQFETLLSHTPRVLRLLPLDSHTSDSRGDIIYEPDVHTYLRKSVPIYLAMFLYGAMVEASVCEQASRMTSMDAASRNAGEIVDDLTLQYNRQRQGAITQEISEIVGGANAI